MGRSERSAAAQAAGWAIAVAVVAVAPPERGGAPPSAPPVALRLVAASDGQGGEGRPWPRAAGIAVPAGWPPAGERLGLFSGAVERPARITAWVARHDGGNPWFRVEPGVWPRDVATLELRPTRSPPLATALTCVAVEHGELLVGGDDGTQWSVERGRVALAAGAALLELDVGRMEVDEHGAASERSPIAAPSRHGPDGGGASWNWYGSFGDEGSTAAVVALRLDVAGDGDAGELELSLRATRDLVVEAWRLRGRLRGDGARLEAGDERVKPDKQGRASVRAVRETTEEPLGALRLRAGSGRHAVELLWSDFARARPGAATLARDGRFELVLVAQPLALHAGQVVRRKLRLHAARWVGHGGGRPWLVARNAARLELDDARGAALDAWRSWFAAELLRPQRLDDRGCYRMEGGDFANGEYDLGGSLLWLGAALGDATWLAAGETLARHSLDWDRTGEEGKEIPPGLFAQHGRDHASGRVEAGHQWIGGALGVARATGDLAALEAAHATVAALATWRRRDPPRFAGPERRVAWPLFASIGVAEATGDEAAVALARELVGATGDRALADGFLDGDRRPFPRGERLWVNSWVTLGITVDALARAGTLLRDPAASAAALKLARAVAAAAKVDGGLAEVALIDPESGLCDERRAQVTGGDAALAAAGLAWLAAAGGDETCATLAATLRSRAWSALATPHAEKAVELAKALHALRSEQELARRP